MVPSLDAQEELWRVWPTAHNYGYPSTLGDFDGDGWNDIVVGVALDVYTVNDRIALRVLSGRTGAVLYERVHGQAQITHPVGVGDVDGDGHSDFAICFVGFGPTIPNRLEVWSPYRDQVILSATGLFYGQFGYLTIGLNLDNDPRNEIVTCTKTNTDSHVFAYDDDGTLLYTLDLLQPNNQQWIRGLGSVGDIDGDGAEDFGVGLVEPTFRGAVALYSGRTGARIRTDFGTQIGDAIGAQIVAMGDMDRDGVPDYAASNNADYHGYRGVITVFSGATGQVIREWSDTQGYYMADKLIGGVDLDLDGVQDVFAGGPSYYNGDPVPGVPWFGRIQALSGRDGGVLWYERNWPTPVVPGVVRSYDVHLGEGLANLGAQPGNPYPVIVVFDWLGQTVAPYTYVRGRLRAIRVNLPATSVSGSGCSSLGIAPQIAVRQDPGNVRVTVSGAPAGAPAWLLAGSASATSWLGYQLPLALDPWALPGCSLQVAPELVFNLVTGTSGWDTGFASFAAPVTVATTGFPVATQWLVLAPSTLDFALTARHDLRVQ